MPIPPRLHRGEVYHARVPPAALFALAQNVATFIGAFLVIDALARAAGAVEVVSKLLVRKNEKKFLPVLVSFTIIGNHAGVAELADAYGSGPYGGNPVKVQVLSPAPLIERAPAMGFFHALIRCPTRAMLDAYGARRARCSMRTPIQRCWPSGALESVASHLARVRVCVRFGRHCCPAALVFPQMNKNQSFAVRNE